MSQSTVNVWNDISYVPQSQHHKHYLDIYGPATTMGKAPVIFFVHGGGWKRGDRKWKHWLSGNKLYQNVGQAFAKRGFVCVVISYRLSNFEKSNRLLLSSFFSFLITFICYLLLSTILHFSGYQNLFFSIDVYAHFYLSALCIYLEQLISYGLL